MGKLKKRSKCVSGIDRISNLPDPLISHILSLLPTKCAVATSVLSTRWEFLWTYITNIDFNSDEGSFSEKTINRSKRKFTHFVNRVLLLLNSPSIQKFHLYCSPGLFDPSYLDSWIRFAFGHAVREIELILPFDDEFENVKKVKLPLSRMYCNVAVLKLYDDIHLNITVAAPICFSSLQTLQLEGITLEIVGNSSISFPNLKILHLIDVVYENEDSADKLLSSCPVLDDLVIEIHHWDALPGLFICIPSLTRLSLEVEVHSSDFPFKVQMDTPALQYLNLEDDLPCEYLCVANLSCLLQANVCFEFIDVDDIENCNSIVKFIGSLSKVKSLSLLSLALKIIKTASINIPTSFHNLTRLELEERDCDDLSVVNNLLENTDNLEHLVMKGWRCNCSNQPQWTEPLNVPKCLLSRITTFSLNCEIGGCYLELLRYFLKNAEVLKLLTVRTSNLSKEVNESLRKKILTFSMRSQTCQVAFN